MNKLLDRWRTKRVQGVICKRAMQNGVFPLGALSNICQTDWVMCRLFSWADKMKVDGTWDWMAAHQILGLARMFAKYGRA